MPLSQLIVVTEIALFISWAISTVTTALCVKWKAALPALLSALFVGAAGAFLVVQGTFLVFGSNCTPVFYHKLLAPDAILADLCPTYRTLRIAVGIANVAVVAAAVAGIYPVSKIARIKDAAGARANAGSYAWGGITIGFVLTFFFLEFLF